MRITRLDRPLEPGNSGPVFSLLLSVLLVLLVRQSRGCSLDSCQEVRMWNQGRTRRNQRFFDMEVCLVLKSHGQLG
ncbi:hypothetical protein B0H67DRAFT_558960 [Lasiosphaeris hirsuta]|uniref:Secreted protein n=1 Tax=Lasiosphaeris hirsuta TaxID=260670 RepID=A0AA40E600_9PEZI|nr:hypothetical protein B0H67DRAFT_558960 [Lasiosphaeris hirsuta]